MQNRRRKKLVNSRNLKYWEWCLLNIMNEWLYGSSAKTNKLYAVKNISDLQNSPRGSWLALNLSYWHSLSERWGWLRLMEERQQGIFLRDLAGAVLLSKDDLSSISSEWQKQNTPLSYLHPFNEAFIYIYWIQTTGKSTWNTFPVSIRHVATLLKVVL